MNVIARCCDDVQIPLPALADMQRRLLYKKLLILSENHCLSTHVILIFKLELRLRADEGVPALIVLAIHGRPHVTLQACAIGSEGDVPCRSCRIKMRFHADDYTELRSARADTARLAGDISQHTWDADA